MCLNCTFCLHILGVEPQLRIHSPEDPTEQLPELGEKKLRRTVKSEGYETISHHSSEIVSEVKQILYLSKFILGV